MDCLSKARGTKMCCATLFVRVVCRFLGTPAVIIGDHTALKEVAELEQQNIISTGYPASTGE
jgi:hypothetical protein